MGLDMYLRAKTNKREYSGATGAAGGIFSIAPEDYGMVEIGYWRKAFDQSSLILSNIHSKPDQNGHLKITKEEVCTILEESKEILQTHIFDPEDEFDITDGYDGRYTSWSKTKWEDTIVFFNEAKKILEEDPNAEIYYLEWY